MEHTMKSVVGLAACVLSSVLIVPEAVAVPIVSIDTDPATPGIQSSLSILLGNPFTVDVVITGVEAGAPLNGFQFDLLFDPIVLGASSVASGGFLPAPSLVLVADLAQPDVNYAEASLGGGGVGQGVLASASFDTLSVGTRALDLTNLILASLVPPGGEISALVNDGSVTVTSGQVIPEPSTVLLLGIGMASLILTSIRRH
jgi:hypothetical protein